MGRGGPESHEVEVKECNVIINSKFVCHGGPTGKILGFSMQVFLSIMIDVDIYIYIVSL